VERWEEGGRGRGRGHFSRNRQFLFCFFFFWANLSPLRVDSGYTSSAWRAAQLLKLKLSLSLSLLRAVENFETSSWISRPLF
jgi:hypothetical protein